jgi:endonuclease-8
VPEGDVLRLTAARLTSALRGLPLVRAELRWPSVGAADLTGATALETSAYGKHLLTRFDDGRTLHTHLRMDGYWRIHRTGSRDASARNPAIRAVLATDAWTATGWHLGMLDLLRTHDEQRILNGLGPDVLGDDFPSTGLSESSTRLVRDPERPLCDVLLDQRTVAGLGTIWMAESLFARRLWPWTPAGALSKDERDDLLRAARRLMERSVAVGRARGLGAVELHVHGRTGRPCHRCGTPISVGSANEKPYERPVYWCPACQALSSK